MHAPLAKATYDNVLENMETTVGRRGWRFQVLVSALLCRKNRAVNKDLGLMHQQAADPLSPSRFGGTVCAPGRAVSRAP